MLVLVPIILAVIIWYAASFYLFIKLKNRRRLGRFEWLSTNGKVISSRIKHYEAESGGDNVKPEEWLVGIRFSYEIAGKTYSSSQDWTQYVPPNSYPSASDIQVFYNPLRNKEAIVNLNAISEDWIGYWLFGIAWLLPIVFCIIALTVFF